MNNIVNRRFTGCRATGCAVRVAAIVLTSLLAMSPLAAQESQIVGSLLSSGFALSSDGSQQSGSSIYTVLGQPLISTSISQDNKLESGALANDILRLVDFSVQVNSEDSVTSGESVRITVIVPENLPAVSGRALYRQGGQPDFVSIDLVGPSAGSFQFDLPPEAITERGVEYYLTFLAGGRAYTFPSINPQNNPLILRVSVAERVAPLVLSPRVHHMISVPLDLGNNDFFAMLQDDYGDYDDSEWRLFRYQNGSYQEYPDIPGGFMPGESYWLVTKSGATFDISDGLSTSSETAFSINLQPGWNQISVPFAFPVAWLNTSSDTLVERPQFYTGSDYQPNVSVLQPWEGYWVNNPADRIVALQVEPREAPASLGKNSDIIPINADREYLLQISATVRSANQQDRFNFVGLLESALTSRDAHDFGKPPAVDNAVRLSIRDEQNQWAGNFKPLGEAGQQWDLLVEGPERDQAITIDLLEKGTIGENNRLYLLDMDYRYILTPVNGRVQIRLTDQFPQRRLRVIVGDETYANQHNDGISLVPLDYELAQNYPNPFNPETRIRYQLKKLTDVRLEIFNILGQRVRTLVDGQQDGGQHVLLWNGQNDAGFSVASGVYLYRIQAGSFTATRKMILVR